jgi:hypothetical protein
MLDPNRYSLDAATVGFRKRMKQSVNWESFNNALQTQTESIKVRRELEETPVSEIHVMGGQLYGIGGNQKTNELALQARQMNGYPLRSFLVTGGPIVLPTKRSEGVMAIPINRGLPQYTQYNGVVGNYASSFTEPLHAPMESGQMLLARAGIQAKSDSIVNPYKALQFQINMHKSQQEITDLEERHQQLRAFNQEGLLKTSMEAQNENLSKAQRQRIMQGAGAASRQALISPDLLKQGKKGLKRGNPMRNAVLELLDQDVISEADSGYYGNNDASDFGSYYSEADSDYGEIAYSGYSAGKGRIFGLTQQGTPEIKSVLNEEEQEDLDLLSSVFNDLDKIDVQMAYMEHGRDRVVTGQALAELVTERRRAAAERSALFLQPHSLLNGSRITGMGMIGDEDDVLEKFNGIESEVTNAIVQQAIKSNASNLAAHGGLNFSGGDLNSPPLAGNATPIGPRTRSGATGKTSILSPLTPGSAISDASTLGLQNLQNDLISP